MAGGAAAHAGRWKGVPVFPGNRETALLTTFSRQASLPAKRNTVHLSITIDARNVF